MWNIPGLRSEYHKVCAWGKRRVPYYMKVLTKRLLNGWGKEAREGKKKKVGKERLDGSSGGLFQALRRLVMLNCLKKQLAFHGFAYNGHSVQNCQINTRWRNKRKQPFNYLIAGHKMMADCPKANACLQKDGIFWKVSLFIFICPSLADVHSLNEILLIYLSY